MKTALGVALGFGLMPATVGLIWLFAWASTRLDLDRAAISIGVFLGLATLLLIAAVGLLVATYA